MEITKKTIKALASDTRLEILKILAEQRKIAADISKKLGLAPSTVNEHLKKLEEAGLIQRKDRGRKWIYYEITSEGQNLIKPKTPVQFILMLSLGFLMMVIGGFKSLFYEAPLIAAPEMLTKGAGERVVAAPSFDWIYLVVFAAGLVLVIIGAYVILRKRI